MNKTAAFLVEFLLIFAGLGALFVPFYRNWGIQQSVSQFLFEDLLLFIASLWDGVSVTNPQLSSDSTTFYLLFFVLLFLALFAWVLFQLFKMDLSRTMAVIRLMLTYYLAGVMLHYGFGKIFQTQFYQPEPNILYTPMGMLDKDILFWSTMGTSYSYNLFLGLFEVIPAVMLFYKRTRTLGLLMLVGVLTHVVVVNFSFDISVKLFSTFLLVITLLLLGPALRGLFRVLVLNQRVVLPHWPGHGLIRGRVWRWSFKAIVILFLTFQAVFYTINPNRVDQGDPGLARLHGAYEVQSVETPASDSDGSKPNLKRLFIHGNSYIIFQYSDDTMEDFYLEIDLAGNRLILTDHHGEVNALQYRYAEASGKLVIRSITAGWLIESKALPWRELPLLQPLFHWTVDGV